MFIIPFLDIPDAPQNLEIHDVASRSVRLTWQKPFDGNFPITRYTIMWRQTDGKQNEVYPFYLPKDIL